MNIIERNFFRLLRAGVFQQEEHIEPMSAWKWRQLYAKAASLQLSALLHDGVTACSSQFFMQLPEDLATTWQQAAESAEAKHRQASS